MVFLSPGAIAHNPGITQQGEVHISNLVAQYRSDNPGLVLVKIRVGPTIAFAALNTLDGGVGICGVGGLSGKAMYAAFL